MYCENVKTLRPKAESCWVGYPGGPVYFSIFDHQIWRDTPLPCEVAPYPALLKFVNLQIHLDLQPSCVRSRVRSCLRYLVDWRNRQNTSATPRRLVVHYDEKLPYHRPGEPFNCEGCNSDVFEKCQYGWATTQIRSHSRFLDGSCATETLALFQVRKSSSLMKLGISTGIRWPL